MMETLYELRSMDGFCRLFDFFEDANTTMITLVAEGKFKANDLFINRVVTE